MNIHIARANIAALAEQIAPMCDGDEQLLQDMLEGEGDLMWIATRIHEQIARDDEILTGIKARKEAIGEREARVKSRRDRLKAGMGELLRAARMTKLELPEATYTVRDGKAKLVITDPDAVPTEYQRLKAEPDKAAINEAFQDTETLPNWLVWEPARDVVTTRTK